MLTIYCHTRIMGDGRATREFVDLTVHEPERLGVPVGDPRIVADYTPMRPERKPPPVKTYPDVESVPVPDELSDLLHWSAGVVRTLGSTPFGTQLFRAAGSAGNLHPLELYVVADDTVSAFDPLGHRLIPLGRVGRPSPTTLLITGVPWRTAWKYRERGFRHLYWDCGTMLAQLLSLAPDARVWLGFDDSAIGELVGADGVHEFPLAMVTFDDHSPVAAPLPGGGRRGTIAADPLEFPLITETQRAGDLTASDVERWQVNPRPQPAHGPRLEDPVAVIRRRGSTRRFVRGESAPADLLTDAFAFATAAVAVDFVEPGSTLLTHHVVVHQVDGVEPGAYRWTGDGFAQLSAGHRRAQTAALCLGQDLAGDGCYTAFHGTDLDTVLGRLGDRGYRAALLEAGIVEGRLHLAAFDRGFGATGLTYFDRHVQHFFDTHDTPLLVTAVGVPATRAPLAGTAGRPVDLGVRQGPR
jgi:hypothetical protein